MSDIQAVAQEAPTSGRLHKVRYQHLCNRESATLKLEAQQ